MQGTRKSKRNGSGNAGSNYSWIQLLVDSDPPRANLFGRRTGARNSRMCLSASLCGKRLWWRFGELTELRDEARCPKQVTATPHVVDMEPALLLIRLFRLTAAAITLCHYFCNNSTDNNYLKKYIYIQCRMWTHSHFLKVLFLN